jgi:hypothetical protein
MLIRCPECSGEVSAEALVCPHCGQPNPAQAKSAAKDSKLSDRDASEILHIRERSDTDIENSRYSNFAATRILPGEEEDILEEIESVVPDSKRWVNSPNELFGGRKPRDLIGTEEEEELRNVLRAIKNGIFS